MTDVPFAAVSGDASARASPSAQALLSRGDEVIAAMQVSVMAPRGPTKRSAGFRSLS